MPTGWADRPHRDRDLDEVPSALEGSGDLQPKGDILLQTRCT